MTEFFEIEGGKKLRGELTVAGSKNAALAILPACLLTDEPCIIKNVPLLTDVLVMIDLIKSLGAEVEWLDDKVVKIQAKNLNSNADTVLVRKIRASILIAGPILARLGELKIAKPGGCHIGVRGLDAHFEGFKDLGIELIEERSEKEKYYLKTPAQLKPANIYLNEFSVTATENLLMLLSSIDGRSEIHLAAAEPHVQELGEVLIKMGAEIEGLGTHTIKIKGAQKLKGIEHTIGADYIEAGTFFSLAATTRSNLKILNVPVGYLEMVFRNLKKIGVSYKIEGDAVFIEGERSSLKAAKIQTLPYPGFPTDLQAPFAALMTQAEGESLIFDTLFEGRFKYVEELTQMGAKIFVCDPHRIIVSGPTPLYGTKIKSFDLRAGATLIIAALAASGKSEVYGIEQVDRGYEKIEERLQSIGAHIKRVVQE
ncbi:MAG: UDP-N-acetylglucosamine 1-carboxyvinyltransferase [Patescibacteria group bacterium]|jgi:UDP-N-acetylglucosamine 1-carboxyvinyltransferase|nr:UDP-N-acetylglucosamine 1-carboxyvinyltransferase [Patescibacteria group bacterium]